MADTSYFIQKQVRENSQDFERYMLDLKNWEDGMKRKEQSTFGDGKEVEETLVRRDDVDYVKEVFEDGKRQMKNGKWELAVLSFSKAIKKYKKNPVFFLKRAKCHIKLKNFEDAEKDCTKALLIDAKLLKAKFLRSQAREHAGHYRGACLDLQDIVILDPPNQTAKAALTRLKPLYLESLRKEGLNIFDDEEKENEEENKSLILGTLSGVDKNDEATMEETIQRANHEKEKGNKYVKEEKWEEAKEAYSLAITLNPEDPIYYANRALCHLKTKNENRAVIDCTMALKKNPRYVKAYMRRAVARKETGDLLGARSDVKQTLLLEPNNSQAKAFLEELNVLIEQEVYRDIHLPDKEGSQSEEEMECESDQQQENEPMEIEHKEATSTTNNHETEIENKGQDSFKYVFPINKPPHSRSKKPLKRIPIKFSNNGVEQCNSEVKTAFANIPEWLCNPVARPLTENCQESMKRSCTESIDEPEEKKQMHTPSAELVCTTETYDYYKDKHNKDFKYIFPIDKKPHQRSKKPLVRVPIKFTK